MLTRAEHEKVSIKQMHIQSKTEIDCNSNQLSTVRVTVEWIPNSQLEFEQKFNEELFYANVEVPAHPERTTIDVKMPLTDPGIVQFEKEIANLCKQFNDTKWY